MKYNLITIILVIAAFTFIPMIMEIGFWPIFWTFVIILFMIIMIAEATSSGDEEEHHYVDKDIQRDIEKMKERIKSYEGK